MTFLVTLSKILTKVKVAGASIEKVIDVKKYSSTQKLYRIISWVNEFANNLKEKLLKNAIL